MTLGSWTCRYNIEQEQQLAQETTVLVESYTVSVYTVLAAMIVG